MNAKRSSSLIVMMCLAAMVVFAVVIAGCTGNGSSTTSATPAATAAPTAVMTTQGSTAAAPSVPAPSAAPGNQTIKISGSTTVLPIVQAAADAYEAAHPDANIQVTGGGSGVGVQAIGAKTVDIGMSSRDVTKDEMAKYPGFVITTIAQDGIAVIVNPQNTIKQITKDQVAGIYTGNTTKWTEITGAGVPSTNNEIVIIGRDSASGTRTYFDQSVLNNANDTLSMQEKNSNGAVLQTVQQTPLSIGYVSIGFLTPDIKALPYSADGVTFVTPSVATVKDKSYPISRNLYLITNGKPTGLTADFINFILSPDGQKIVADQGYVTLS